MQINMNPLMGLGLGGGSSMVNWGGGFGNCCQRTLGGRQSGLTGALLGGLVGTLAGGGNPLFGLLGAGVGGLLGSAFGQNQNQYCNSQNQSQCMQQPGCYPPNYGGSFGGQQYGGYNCQPNYGSQYNNGGGYSGQFNTGGYGTGADYSGQFGGGYGNMGGQQYGGSYGGNYGSQFPGQFNQGGGFGGGGMQQWGGNYGQQYGQQCGQNQWSGGQNYNFGCQGPQNCCCPNQRQDGAFKQEGGEGKPMEYKTSGGYTIKVDKHTITITDPKGKNTMETWGDPHENVNGKHVSDWQGKQRTIVLEDGTKITMGAKGPTGVTESTSIYDGRQNIQIDNNNNKVTHRSLNPRDTFMRDQDQYDGQAALFSTNNRTGVANFADIYNQDSAFNVTSAYKQIASTGGYRNPGQVTDHIPGTGA